MFFYFKRFSKSRNFHQHKRTHSGDKPYECDVCNKRFSQSGNLTLHKRTHTGDKPYECDACKKTFTQKQSLKRHRQTHFRNGLLLCNTCGREIIPEQGLANKVSNGNHYNCDKCNKQFLDLHCLNQHKAKDHGTSYKCDACQELEASEATGIGYICFICDTEFEIATELEKNHIGTHENVLPHGGPQEVFTMPK